MFGSDYCIILPYLELLLHLKTNQTNGKKHAYAEFLWDNMQNQLRTQPAEQDQPLLVQNFSSICTIRCDIGTRDSYHKLQYSCLHYDSSSPHIPHSHSPLLLFQQLPSLPSQYPNNLTS
ncbi:hypothetical protein ACSQ67_017771 [Phaseolus vulgaris]